MTAHNVATEEIKSKQPLTHLHQKRFHPAILPVWKKYQESLQVASAVIGEDGKANSPGHNAKYGSYSVSLASQTLYLSVMARGSCGG